MHVATIPQEERAGERDGEGKGNEPESRKLLSTMVKQQQEQQKNDNDYDDDDDTSAATTVTGNVSFYAKNCSKVTFATLFDEQCC